MNGPDRKASKVGSIGPVDWHGEKQAADPELTRPMWRMIRQSTLGAADICMRRAQYGIAGYRDRTDSEAALLGTAIHAGLEHVYEQQIEGRHEVTETEVSTAVQLSIDELTGLLTSAVRRGTMTFEDPDETVGDATDRLSGEIDAMTRFYLAGQTWPLDWEVIATELEFHREFLPRWDATGTIDLVVYHPGTRTLVFDDHKTSKRMWSESKADPRVNNQAAWYSLWGLEELNARGLLPSGVRELGSSIWSSFSVLRRPTAKSGVKFRRFMNPVGDSHWAHVLEKATSLATLLDAGVPLPTNAASNLCSGKYCDYWYRCPAGAALTPERD